MISFEEAGDIVMAAAHPLEPENVELQESLGRILAEDVLSDIDMPPFNKSAMDGYACRRADLDGSLRVIEEIPAGAVPRHTVSRGQCSKIMTGAIIPAGADCVIMVEQTEIVADGTVRFSGKNTRDNICLKGEDIKAGEPVLRRGTLIRPEHIAVLAAVGCARPRVAARPRVGIITTGSELVPFSECPPEAKIRDSNGPQLAAQARRSNALVKYYGIVADSEQVIDEAFKKAVAENDVVLMSGGVSMGDYDLVPAIMKQNNFEIMFDKVAVKPGKPSTFAVNRGKVVFGLPGNPVSTFIQFEMLVKPFLYRMGGHDYRPVMVQARCGATIERRRTERLEFIPVAFDATGSVRVVDYHGSAHINAVCYADGLIALPVGLKGVEKGESLDVRLF